MGVTGEGIQGRRLRWVQGRRLLARSGGRRGRTTSGEGIGVGVQGPDVVWGARVGDNMTNVPLLTRKKIREEILSTITSLIFISSCIYCVAI
jgi:hypothetical protein